MQPVSGDDIHRDLPTIAKPDGASSTRSAAFELSRWSSGDWEAVPDERFDTSVPHPARVYGFWLGGKDHYAADRKAGRAVIRQRPEVIAGALANRRFLGRVVRYLAGQCGVRQFLDIGTGLPAPDNTHEVAQAVAPECRVVYADNDPIVLAHARALLTSHPKGACDYVDADLRDATRILTQACATLDFTQPAAVLLLAVLHFLADADDPAALVAAYTRALAPGSFVVITHLTADFAPAEVGAGVKAYTKLVPSPLVARTHSQVSALFGGLVPVAPGVVPVTEWRPATPDPASPRVDLYAGVGKVSGERM